MLPAAGATRRANLGAVSSRCRLSIVSVSSQYGLNSAGSSTSVAKDDTVTANCPGFIVE